MYVTLLSTEQNQKHSTKCPFTATRNFVSENFAFILVCALCRRIFLPQKMLCVYCGGEHGFLSGYGLNSLSLCHNSTMNTSVSAERFPVLVLVREDKITGLSNTQLQRLHTVCYVKGLRSVQVPLSSHPVLTVPMYVSTN